MKKIIIIGAGLGGLSAACRLAKAGFSVTVLEKNESVGGKVNFIEAGGYKFDTGASLVTLPHIFEELFEFCGKSFEDYLTFERLDPICRYFWSDGTILDVSQNLEKTERQIAGFAPEDVGNFRKYVADAKQKYEIAEKTFLSKSLNELPELLTAKNLPDLMKISSLKTLDKHNANYFKSEKMRQLFNRFATYNGSSPYKTPATFALIPYVEFGFGAWYVRGGIYEIPKALEKLALELGVEFLFDANVEKIFVVKGKATGVKLKNELDDEDFLFADIIISNADAVVTYRELIEEKDRKSFPDKKLDKREPSSSGFVLLLGAKKKFPQLAHHNIFFSDDYRAEFRHIFDVRIPTPHPTIYVSASSVTDKTQAPKGSENLFVLVNVPYMRWQVNWQFEAQAYRDVIIEKLEKSGLENLSDAIEFEEFITPEDFEYIYRANKGSIYGISSNGILSAFRRIPNKAKDIENLYFTGGATHPGGGMPLVLLSGKMAAELIINK
ncbi:phytoene desaturase family protein [soil metagenome]